MSASSMLITDAGIAEVINAEKNGTAPVVLTHVGLGTGQYEPTSDLTALKAEFKRLSTTESDDLPREPRQTSISQTRPSPTRGRNSDPTHRGHADRPWPFRRQSSRLLPPEP